MILHSIFLSEEPNIDVASFNFVEIDLVRPSVNGRHVFKEKYLEEPPQKWISTEKVPQGARRSAVSSF